ncbi:helix-turn-helix domain-containing protein [Aeribacillus alveayuensis]|uniref:Transcriptional regulator with XRE-family HTH domain n=1 Tax=Aeribacillus alveayuensis TaxID=279215 RepID=A0ABT9VN08_9BACI|nr:transcriptional regulator with XRE-family HTH domain [Bacillus alveayuensis]
MNSVQRNIGRNLQKIRKSRNLSLDKTAELTGVSKAMLGQIERGESNPSVSTLWKIANGLHVSFSSLMKEEKTSVNIVSLKDISPVIDDDGKYLVFSLFPFEVEKQFEVFSVVLEANYTHDAEGHHEGVEEYVLVQKGELEIMIDEKTYHLSEGDAIQFQADKPHKYRNKTNEMVKFLIIIYYPE